MCRWEIRIRPAYWINSRNLSFALGTRCKAAISVKGVKLRFIWIAASLTSLFTSLLTFKGGINYGYTGTLSSAEELPVGSVIEAPPGGKKWNFLSTLPQTVTLSDRFICQVLWADVYANDSPLVG